MSAATAGRSGGVRLAPGVDVDSLLADALDCMCRKAVALLSWGIPVEPEYYFEYGPGGRGLARMLRELGYTVVYADSKFAVDSEGRVYPYYESPYEILWFVENYRDNVWKPVVRRIPEWARPTYAAALGFALHFAGLPDDNNELGTFMDLAGLLAEELQGPEAVYIDFYLGEFLGQALKAGNPEDMLRLLDNEAKSLIVKYTKAKDEDARRRLRSAAKAMVLLEGLAGYKHFARHEDKLRQFTELVEEGPLGAALQLAHTAALSSISRVFHGYDDVVRFLEESGLEETDNLLAYTLKRLAKGFYDTARALLRGGAIHEDDYKRMHLALTSGRIYVKVGGAMGHYALVEPAGAGRYTVVYSDHDIRRLEALADFVHRTGFGKITHYSDRDVVFEFETTKDPYEIGRLLATLASVDLSDEYDVYYKASTVDEVIEDRIRESAGRKQH